MRPVEKLHMYLFVLKKIQKQIPYVYNLFFNGQHLSRTESRDGCLPLGSESRMPKIIPVCEVCFMQDFIIVYLCDSH